MFSSWRIATAVVACLFVSCPILATGAEDMQPAAVDKSPSALQARLDRAEKSFHDGKVSLAVDEASSLINLVDSSFLQSDQVAREAKADLAVFQLKAGHPDETARLMRELLLSLQLDMPILPEYDVKSSEILIGAPAMLKEYFAKVVDRLGETSQTKLIVDSIIDNTCPKDYAAQIKAYSKNLQVSMLQLEPLRSTAESEELKYSDSLSELEPEQSGQPGAADADALKKIGASLDKLATQAQQMPLGELRPVLGLYRLALVANSQKNYPLAEEFARQSAAHLKAVPGNFPITAQIQLALAYALMQEGKKVEFKSVMDALLKRIDGEERLLVGAARLTERSGDAAGALNIYQQALAVRTKGGAKSAPDWNEAYARLLKKVGTSN